MSGGQFVSHLTQAVTSSLNTQMDGWYVNMQRKYVPGVVQAQQEAYDQEMARRHYAQQAIAATQSKENYDMLAERNRQAHARRLKSRSGQTASSRPGS